MLVPLHINVALFSIQSPAGFSAVQCHQPNVTDYRHKIQYWSHARDMHDKLTFKHCRWLFLQCAFKLYSLVNVCLHISQA